MNAQTAGLRRALVGIGALIVTVTAGSWFTPAAAAFPAAPGTVSIGWVHIWEPDAGVVAAEVPLTLTTPLPNDIVVRWQFASCTSSCANVGEDFRRPKVFEVPIRAGSTRAFVTIAVTGDDDLESDEWINIQLIGVFDPGNTATISPDYSAGGVQILDDEAANFPSQFLAMGSTEVVEGDGNGLTRASAGNPITLGQPVGYDILIEYVVDGGTADPWVDFRLTPSSWAKIPAGRQVAQARLLVVADTDSEPNEFADVFIHDVSDTSIPVMTENVPLFILLDDPPV